MANLYGFYNENKISKGRKDKICSICGEPIPKGTSHIVVPTECYEGSYNLHIKCHQFAKDNALDEGGALHNDIEMIIYRYNK